MSFLPKDYKVPASSGQFMKIEDGDNRIRVLSDAIVGWELWKDGKPIRRKGTENPFSDKEISEAELSDYTGKPKVNHFWAFVVYNVTAKQIQVLQIGQKTIQRAIENYYILDEYGDPKGYDLIIKKSKVGDKTEYNVQAMPPKALPLEVEETYKKTDIKLDALFDGKYPVAEGNTKDVPFD